MENASHSAAGRVKPLALIDDDVDLVLGRIAFENYHAQVFHAWLNLPEQQMQEQLRDRYVFLSVCGSVERYIANLKSVDYKRATLFVESFVAMVGELSAIPVPGTEEWFKGLNALSDGLVQQNYIAEARGITSICLRMGVAKFPGIAQAAGAQVAYLDALIGRKDKAAKMALKMLHRPFVLPNRRELPKLYYKFMYILAASNHLREYRHVIWRGASSIHADRGLRDEFVGQIIKTYRGAFRAMLAGDTPIPFRISFLLGHIARWVGRWSIFAVIKADLPFVALHLAWMEVLNLSKLTPLPSEGENVAKGFRLGIPSIRLFGEPRRILVTRAMGGIGDLLMMTPGLMALRRRYRNAQIDFAVPKSFHALLANFSGANVLDINDEVIDFRGYDRWVNLTDCPAGRVEAKQFPNVRRNRIEIFAKSMGISKGRLRRSVGFLPYYKVDQEELRWAQARLAELNPNGLPVIGIQPYAADTYRNWPFMEEFVKVIAPNYCVLVFHHEPVQGYEFENAHKIVEPLRKSLALVSLCEQLVVLDSSFLHFSAALRIPTTAIFGAISGKLRTKNYPNVRLLAPSKKEFPCYPCWRHEHKPCHLTNGRESICFRSISVGAVVNTLGNEVNVKQRIGIAARLFDFIKYGAD